MIISPQQAAERLGVSARRVLALIKSGQLPARKLGEGRNGSWLIEERDLKRVQMRPDGKRGPEK